MPIQVRRGDLLSSKAEALVNPVNTKGVMGKGLAEQFRKTFGQNGKMMNDYLDFCRPGLITTIQPGTVRASYTREYLAAVNKKDFVGLKSIIFFATKDSWRFPSKISWIKSGLGDLRTLIIQDKYKSIAVPRLGSGLGGLDWDEVRPLIEAALEDLDCQVELFV